MKIIMLADAVCDGVLRHKNDVLMASQSEANRLIAAKLAAPSKSIVTVNTSPGVIIE
jgi:hypothetical protein